VPREQTYVALGDSTGVGVGAHSGGGYPDRLLRRLHSRHPGLQLVNLCESGATSSDVLQDQVPRALRTIPRLITIGVGINDVGMQQPDDAFALNLEEIVSALTKLDAPIAVTNLPDLALAPAVARLVPVHLYEQRLQVFNEHIESTAARHNLTLIDLWSLSRASAPGRPELFSEDGFHPSGDGYEQWADLMWPAIESLLHEGRGAGI
jgi:lysophospholipase L1-like esterase